MTKQKEIGYEVGNVAWHNLDGYQELWNKADFEIKEKIVNEQGRLAIELSIPVFSKRWAYKSLLVSVGIGLLIGFVLAIALF
jgi:hypothetical protein